MYLRANKDREREYEVDRHINIEKTQRRTEDVY